MYKRQDNRNATFFNDALGIESYIDYFIVSDACTMLSFKVTELDIDGGCSFIMSKLLTYYVLRPTQPPTLRGTGNE